MAKVSTRWIVVSSIPGNGFLTRDMASASSSLTTVTSTLESGKMTYKKATARFRDKASSSLASGLAASNTAVEKSFGQAQTTDCSMSMMANSNLANVMALEP